MNFLSIEYFLIVANELNFSKAAARLYISPQSLSSQIRNLEAELGVSLFLRTHPLSLTYAGKKLRDHAYELLAIKTQISKEIQDIKDFRHAELTIGISHSLGRVILPEVLPIFHNRFPEIDLKLREGNISIQLEALLNNQIDLMIGLLPFASNEIETVPLYDEDILLLVPDSILKESFPDTHETLKQQLSKSVNLRVLQNCPFLMMTPTNHIRTLADDVFKTYNVSPKVVLETETVETLLYLCCQGMGLTFYPKTLIPKSGFHHKRFGNVHAYSLNYKTQHGKLGVGYHKNRYTTQPTLEFVKLLREVFVPSADS